MNVILTIVCSKPSKSYQFRSFFQNLIKKLIDNFRQLRNFILNLKKHQASKRSLMDLRTSRECHPPASAATNPSLPPIRWAAKRRRKARNKHNVSSFTNQQVTTNPKNVLNLIHSVRSTNNTELFILQLNSLLPYAKLPSIFN